MGGGSRAQELATLQRPIIAWLWAATALRSLSKPLHRKVQEPDHHTLMERSCCRAHAGPPLAAGTDLDTEDVAEAATRENKGSLCLQAPTWRLGG